jgi:glycosyltransferase involved in cell wall biosynthesis
VEASQADAGGDEVMNTRGPLVSVIIPAYNAGRYIAETLDSVLSQSYADLEVIVVDDGSTDNTRAIVEGYGPRVVYVHQENSGAPARPRNVGIARAKGRYISFFDSDDVMMPGKLALSVAFAERHPELGLVFTNFVQFTEEGDLPGLHLDRYTNFRSLPKTKLEENGFRLDPAVAFESLFFGNYIGTSSVLVPANVLKEVGGFDEEVSPGGLEDRDMWFRIARRYPFGFLDIVGHRYRI